MYLPFDNKLLATTKFDTELSRLADRHYSRQKPGAEQFVPPGKTMTLRDNFGLIVFVWLVQRYRLDGQPGYNCSIFRNESPRQSSSIILEAERIAFERWGPARMFTYINPARIKSNNPGYCFKQAGWKLVRTASGAVFKSAKGNLLLEKFPG